MTNQTVSNTTDFALDLFDRDGQPAPAGKVQFDGGKPYYIRRDKCQRCGGSGIYTQFHGTCYRCAGRGIVDHLDIHKVKLYTREQNAKLDAAKAKAAAKKAAKVEAALQATTRTFNTTYAALLATIPTEWLAGIEYGVLVPGLPSEANIVSDIVYKGRHTGAISEKQAALVSSLIERWIPKQAALAAREAARQQQAATSQFVGTISEKLAVAVTCTKVATFERDSFGYRGGRETVNVCTFVDAAGNILVTKTPTFRAEVGEAGILTGQVKQHNVYQDVKQTQLIRPRWQA